MNRPQEETDLAPVEQGIQEFLDDRGGGMPLGWVMVLEHLLPDGERALSIMSSPDVRSWQVLGWLDYTSAAIRSEVQDEEREDRLRG